MISVEAKDVVRMNQKWLKGGHHTHTTRKPAETICRSLETKDGRSGGKPPGEGGGGEGGGTQTQQFGSARDRWLCLRESWVLPFAWVLLFCTIQPVLAACTVHRFQDGRPSGSGGIQDRLGT